jgi:hypothetical protein
LDVKEREYFNMRADEDKGRHLREMEVWNNHVAHNPAAQQWKKQKNQNRQAVYTQPAASQHYSQASQKATRVTMP